VHDLETTINRVDCDAVIIGTPIDLRRVIKINKPSVRARYDLAEISSPGLADVLSDFFGTCAPQLPDHDEAGTIRYS
jgi:predicted GTPase